MKRGILFPVIISLIIISSGVAIADAVGNEKSAIARTLQNDNIHRAQQSFHIGTVEDGSQITSTNVGFTLDSNIGDQCVLILNEAHLNKDQISLPFTCEITNDISLEIKGVHALQTKLNTDNFEVVVQSLTNGDIIPISSDQLTLDISYLIPTYFAKIENGIVTNVIVAEQSMIDTLSGTWVESFDVVPLKAIIGYTYDSNSATFKAVQPFNSWSYDNVTFQWLPPTPYPNDGLRYNWNEDVLEWVELS